MGSTSSVPFADRQDVLQRLGGAEPIPPQDALWTRLASEAPMARTDPGVMEQKLGHVCRQLLAHNSHTGNFQVLLTFTISLLNDVQKATAATAAATGAAAAAAGPGSTAPVHAHPSSLPAANALHLVGLVIKTAAQQGYSAADLAGLFEVPASLPVPSLLVHQGQNQLMRVLVRRVVAVVASSGDGQTSHQLLFNAMLLLVLLCSPMLHGPSARAPAGRQPLLDCLYQQKQLAAPLVHRLLQVYLQQPQTPSSERPWQDPALLQAAAAAQTTSLLWAPWSAFSSIPQPTSPAATTSSAQNPRTASPGTGQLAPRAGPSPLADMALQLLLLLVYGPDDPPSTVNPYRRTLAAMQDEPPTQLVRGSGDDGYSNAASSSMQHSPAVAANGLYTLPTQLSGNLSRLESAASNGHGAEHYAYNSAAAGTTNTSGALSFKQLHDALCTWGLAADPELAVLLLYSLLHGCTAFQNHALGRTDVELLLVPLLQQLYTCPAHASSHAYLLQVLLLLLSQDMPLMQAIQHTHLPAAQLHWYQDHAFGGASITGSNSGSSGQVSLGSFMVCVLVKAVLTGYGSGALSLSSGFEVEPLPTNALAALANLAPSIMGLHHHAAQRLVGLFKALARRHNKLLLQLQGQAQAQVQAQAQAQVQVARQAAGGQNMPAAGQQQHPAEAAAAATAASRDAFPQLAVLEDFMQVVLEIIVVPLVSSGAQRNPELVYALLQHQEAFVPFATHPRMAEQMASIQDLLSFFNRRLEEAQGAAAVSGGEWGVSRVMEVVMASALYWRPSLAATRSDSHAVRFVYEEEGHPEDFFLPHLWLLLVPRLPVRWDTTTFRLPGLGPATS